MTNKTLTVCKLTSPELQRRKMDVVLKLKTSVSEKMEIDSGFVYRFEGTDNIIDRLTTFIVTERICCDFFIFEIKVDKANVWLTLTGPPGTKEFINSELGF